LVDAGREREIVFDVVHPRGVAGGPDVGHEIIGLPLQRGEETVVVAEELVAAAGNVVLGQAERWNVVEVVPDVAVRIRRRADRQRRRRLDNLKATPGWKSQPLAQGIVEAVLQIEKRWHSRSLQ
jgi:hypothetical protein